MFMRVAPAYDSAHRLGAGIDWGQDNDYTVLAIFDRNTLEEMTGFRGRKTRNILFQLKKEGKIRSERKEGLRGKAYGLGMSRVIYLNL